MGHIGYDSSPTTREVGEYKGVVHVGAGVKVGDCQTPPVPVRANFGCTSCCALDKGKIQRDSKDGARPLRRHQAVGKEGGVAEQMGQGGHNLVAQFADQRLQAFAQKCSCLGDNQIGNRRDGYGHWGSNERYDTVHEQRYILVPSQFDANFFKNKRSFMQLSTLGVKGDAGEHFRPKNRPRKAYRVLNLHFL